MTDLLTIVFTGLVIIHPSGDVNAIKADNHKLTVRMGDKSYEVKKSISFEGFDARAQKLTGEMPPDLRQIFSTSSENLTVKDEMALTFRVPGGKTSRGGKSVTCSVNGDPVVFSAGIVWEGRATRSANLVIDGKKYSLAGIDAIGVSNEYQGKATINHLPMYMSVLNGADLKYNEPVCVVPVIPSRPIFCPPVSLWP